MRYVVALSLLLAGACGVPSQEAVTCCECSYACAYDRGSYIPDVEPYVGDYEQDLQTCAALLDEGDEAAFTPRPCWDARTYEAPECEEACAPYVDDLAARSGP